MSEMKPVTSAFRVIAPSPAATVRLIAFPYAGGTASFVAPWRPMMPPAVELLSVQLPGRESRIEEAPVNSLGPLLHMLRESLAALDDRPFAMYGHSMGALIAFEVARDLRRHSLPGPCHLFVSSFPAPHLYKPPADSISDAELLDEMHSLGHLPAAVMASPELLEMMLPALRADVELCLAYRYHDDDPLDCAITAFLGAEESAVRRPEVEGWAAQTRQRCHAETLPGSHHSLVAEAGPLVSRLLHHLPGAVPRDSARK